MKNGIITEYNEDGTIKSEKFYINDKLTGLYREYRHCEYYTVEKLFDEYKGGYQTYYFWKYHESNRLLVYFFSENKAISEIPKQRKLKPFIYQSFYESGELKCEVNYENGKKNGLAKVYFKSGDIIEEVSYIDDLIDGDRIIFYWDEKYKLKYTMGKLNGTCRVYYKTGRTAQVLNFVDGKLQGLNKWNYKSAKHRFRTNFVDGVKHGLDEIYHSNGKLWVSAEFSESKLNGISIQYNENGSIRLEEYYEDDLKHGLEKKYSWRTNCLESESEYVNGKLHGACKD